MSAPAHVALDKVTFQYAGKDGDAIRSVDLDIHEGEFVLLTGRSGCGKTTVARLINGLIPHFYAGELEGAARVGGTDTRDLGIGDIGRLVGSVFQDPRSQFFMTDTTSEVAFGCVNAGLPRAEVLERVEDAFRRMGIQHLRGKSVFGLSSGEMQMVAIASCYAMGPSVYVFDEPSANLDMEAVEALRKALSELKREGKTVIVLEHRLFYLSSLIDRMVVIEDGAVSRVYDAASALSLDDTTLAHMGLRSLQLKSALSAIPDHEPLLSKHEGTAFEAKGLTFSYGSRRPTRSAGSTPHRSCTLGPLSFSAQPGEVIGIIGENGAGKTTLFRLIMGLETVDKGEFEVGETVKVAYVDQQHRDIDPNKSVYQVISGGNELIRMGGRDINARAYLSRFNFSGGDQEKLCGVLSGGERNRLHLAMALKEEGNVLLLDEPTNDIDVNTLRALEEGLEDFAGCAVVISHDRWFLDRICTHILAFEGDSNVFYFEGSYSEYEENKMKRLGNEEPKRVRYRKLMTD